MDFEGILFTLLALALYGFIVYLITTYIPMSEIFKQVINVICVVLVITYVISIFTGHAQLIHFGGFK